jgi:integrase
MENAVITPKKRKRPFESYTLYAFSAGELRDLLAACGKMHDYIMILLASRYGFRREDIVKIKIANVHLKEGTITYHEHKKDKDRTIPIEADVVQELTRYIGTIPKGRIFLFPFTDGTTAWQHLQDICAIAKIPVPSGRTGRPFHSLRGTCVKMRQAAGWSVNEVAALVGDEPETVSKHYLTVSPSELAEKMKGV